LALGLTGWLVVATLAAAGSPALPGLPELESSAKKLLDVKLEQSGEVKVEAVRRRLGALAALTGSARPMLRAGDVPTRLAAHAALAEAHEAFAKELFAAKAPKAARGESAARAWAEQMQTTVGRALESAKGHARSCVALAKAMAPKDPAAARCSALLDRTGEKAALPTEPAQLAKARMGELQVCFDVVVAERPTTDAVDVKATLLIDGHGRVEDVTLSPRREDQRAFYECVADGLWIWVFPGVSDAEIELPIKLVGARR